MIRVRLELLPGGNEDNPELLGEILISNDFVRSMETVGRRGGYEYQIFKKRRSHWHRGHIKNFPRLSYHPWNLIREILNQAAENNGGRI